MSNENRVYMYNEIVLKEKESIINLQVQIKEKRKMQKTIPHILTRHGDTMIV